MAGNGVAIILYSLIAVTIIAIMSIILYVLDKSTILTFMLFGRIKS